MKNLTTYKEFLNESNDSDKLAIEIEKAIDRVDDSLSYADFAMAVAKVLEDNYGEHNYEVFVNVLKTNLGVK